MGQAELLDGNQLLGVAPEEELEQREAGDLRARKAFPSDLRDLEVADVADPGGPPSTMDIPWIYHDLPLSKETAHQEHHGACSSKTLTL